MAVITSRRVRDLEWVDWFNNRRLLEPIGNIPPAEAEERYYAMLEQPAMAACTQTKWPPTNPGRFIELTGRPAKHLVSETVSAERGFVGYGCYWPMLTESKARVIMSYCDQTPGRAPTCATQSIPVRGRES
jgi:hypothetical protein